MNEPLEPTMRLNVTDLQSFAAQLRYDIEYVLQPAHSTAYAEVWATLGHDRPNQALGNHELNPAAQLIGAGIELNLRGVAEHLGSLIESMRFMAELAEAIASEHRTIDEQNSMDATRFGEFATMARAAVDEYHAAQVETWEAAVRGNEQQ